MDQKERSFYEDSLKDYRDLKSALDTSYKEGRLDQAMEMAVNAISEGLSNEVIAKLTGLSIEQIIKLRKEQE